MTRLFCEIKIGSMFTFIHWGRGVMAFTKISDHTAEDDSGYEIVFNANDPVQTL